jgi:hypothetical protein
VIWIDPRPARSLTAECSGSGNVERETSRVDVRDAAARSGAGPDRLALLTTDTDLEDAAKEILGSEVGSSAVAIARLEEEPAADGAAEPEKVPTPDYQMLETYDHPILLDQALRETQHQLVIVSPWIKSRVVDDAFVGRLRNLLRNGVDVYVGYGFRETETQDDSDAVKALTRLAEEAPELRVSAIRRHPRQGLDL